MTFHSSTLIEKIFHHPAPRRQLFDSPGFFELKILARIHHRIPNNDRMVLTTRLAHGKDPLPIEAQPPDFLGLLVYSLPARHARTHR
jgi:hypothetical protein